MKKHIRAILLPLICCAACAQAAKEPFIVKQEFIFDKAPFKQCHASTVESTPHGLVAAWFGGTKEADSDVEIWVSRNINGKWSAPVSAADGVQENGERFACWNPVLYQVPNGELLLFYKVGTRPPSWRGMLKRSKDGGLTWSKAESLPKGILGPIKNKPILTADGILICPSSTEEKITKPNAKFKRRWLLHFETSTDFGKTWSRGKDVEDPNWINAIQPSILSYNGGKTLQALARTGTGKLSETWSNDGGRTWGELKNTTLPNPCSGTDAVTLRDGRQLLVYNPTTIREDGTGGPRAPISLAISSDGISWKKIADIESGSGGFSYPAIIQDKDGLVHITYTWKRKNIRYVLLDAKKLPKN